MKRRHERDPDAPVPREISSPGILANRVREVAWAFVHGDENAARESLRQLAAEASLLAASDPLCRSQFDNRVRVAIEREPAGRGGSS
jgi:hypothetical protein